MPPSLKASPKHWFHCVAIKEIHVFLKDTPFLGEPTIMARTHPINTLVHLSHGSATSAWNGPDKPWPWGKLYCEKRLRVERPYSFSVTIALHFIVKNRYIRFYKEWVWLTLSALSLGVKCIVSKTNKGGKICPFDVIPDLHFMMKNICSLFVHNIHYYSELDEEV